MRIAVLGSPRSWYLADLRRAADGRHVIESLPFSEVATSVNPQAVSSSNASLDDFDAVLIRTMPPGSLEQVVFRMDALAQLEARGTLVVNPPKAIEVAVDKYLATARLAAAALPVPPTAACQTVDAALTAFHELGRDVVMKPLFGSEGRGIVRLNDENMAQRAFALIAQLGGVIYLQKYIEHEGCDLRLLVVGQRVLGMRRYNPLDWRTNVSRGAKAEPFGVTPLLAALAHRAAAAVGAPLAGVDLLPGRDGTLYAIEVNAVPGWQALSRVTATDVAALVLAEMAAAT
jgi:ribosomal protein S6--L-glutamate ligase